MAECAEIKELTTAIVNRLIEKIEVSEPQTIDGEKVQNIRIFLQVRWRNQLNFHNVPIIQEPLKSTQQEISSLKKQLSETTDFSKEKHGNP